MDILSRVFFAWLRSTLNMDGSVSHVKRKAMILYFDTNLLVSIVNT